MDLVRFKKPTVTVDNSSPEYQLFDDNSGSGKGDDDDRVERVACHDRHEV
jgi:hypothetical protein